MRDFFGRQELARRNTLLLLVLFPLAVTFVLAAVNGVYFLFTIFSIQWIHAGSDLSPYSREHWLAVNLVAALLILGGSLFRFWTLRLGGRRVAESLGGREIGVGATPLERRFRNVVEEMATAARMPLPGLYVLEGQEGINAFAAGHTPADAAVAVTAGALKLLNREELQGVVAHEFSHIANGDMRLNLRLMGVLFGIQLISLAGREMAEKSHRITVGGTSRSPPQILVLMIVGFLLWLAGYLGLLMAQFIKAAVSRQREFLADAAAVQYTRNPHGLARALMKIGGLSYGSRVRHGKAEEASHLFFARLGGDFIWDGLATHPPLEERIRRLDPSFVGVFPKLHGQEWFGFKEALGGISALSSGPALDHPAISTGEDVEPTAIMPPPRGWAVEWWQEIPHEILTALNRETTAPVRVLLALLLTPGSGDDAQREEVALSEGEAGANQTLRWANLMHDAGRHLYLPVVDGALTKLRGLPRARREAVVASVERLVRMDGRETLTEYVIRRVVTHALTAPERPEPTPSQRLHSWRKVRGECALVLSLLARLAHRDRADELFALGAAKVGEGLTLAPAEACTLRGWDGALERLSGLDLAYREALVGGCWAVVTADGVVGHVEGGLMRVMAEVWDVAWPGLPQGVSLER